MAKETVIIRGSEDMDVKVDGKEGLCCSLQKINNFLLIEIGQ